MNWVLILWISGRTWVGKVEGFNSRNDCEVLLAEVAHGKLTGACVPDPKIEVPTPFSGTRIGGTGIMGD